MSAAHCPEMFDPVAKKITSLPFIPSPERMRPRPKAHRIQVNHEGYLVLNVETVVSKRAPVP